MSHRIRRAGLALAALVALPLTTPAMARGDKPVVIRMPASSLKDPAARLCMPKTVLPKAAAAGRPDTICQTRDEWAAAGVTITER